MHVLRFAQKRGSWRGLYTAPVSFWRAFLYYVRRQEDATLKRLLLVVALALSIAPSYAQGYVKLYGGNNGASVPSPASSSNPIPVSIEGGTGGSVAVTSTVNPTGTTAANATSVTAAIPATSTTVTLTAASSNITLWNYSSTATLYFQPNSAGTATTSNFGIPPGFAFTFTGLPAISSFKVIGSAASGNYGVFAH